MTNTRPQPTSSRVLDTPPDRELVLRSTGVEPWRAGISAWSGLALRNLGFFRAAFAWSIACFTILVTGAAVTASALFLVVGVFLCIGFVHVLRWTTSIDC